MGREFIDLFDEWSKTYDQTVVGHDEEYKEVFHKYDDILQAVSNEVTGNIIEFGVGTGNLTHKLLQNGTHVVGIEPSSKMREKAVKKVEGTAILDGDFLDFPIDGQSTTIHAFVSSYAFHHLTDSEKRDAIQNYSKLLSKDGKIVFADTIFVDEKAKEDMIKWAEDQHYFNLALDLKTEYYTTIPYLTKILEANGFTVEFTQMNKFVWIMNAKKIL